MDSYDGDDEDTVENDFDSDSNDPWENLQAEKRDVLSPSYVKQVEQFLDKGASRAVAKAEALNVLLLAHRRKLRRLHLHYFKWFRGLKWDPVHQEVMNTLRRFTDENSMDYVEAAVAAVDKRNFLLNCSLRGFKFLTKNKKNKTRAKWTMQIRNETRLTENGRE